MSEQLRPQPGDKVVLGALTYTVKEVVSQLHATQPYFRVTVEEDPGRIAIAPAGPPNTWTRAPGA